ncbi:MAG: molybdenum cofactor guanylyltransferase [Thermodesulfobacteriota bacterium]|nr:molybdenum cofactor guanylyltransferase [Thermodesulfobacteriota bacterium]
MFAVLRRQTPNINMVIAVDICAVILAGGLSRRMGQDKLFLDVGGVPLFERVLRPIQQLFTFVMVIANQHQNFKSYDLPIYHDIYPGSALGGIHSALHHATTGWVFVTAADLPFVNMDVARYLLSFIDDDCDVVVPSSDKGFEPLFACYSKRCLPVMEQALKCRQFKIIDVLANLRVCEVPITQLVDIRDIDTAFINLNRVEDVRHSKQLLACLDG